MVGVPVPTPVTIPELVPAVACEVLLLLHVPPEVPSLNVIVAPMHTADAPVIAAGDGLTVIVAALTQPVEVV